MEASFLGAHGAAMKVLAIDYDATFDACRTLWMSLANNARALGFVVVCVTNRPPENPLPPMDAGVFHAVIYAADTPKRQAALEAGLVVDWWVDDMPEQVGSALRIGSAR